MNRGSNIDHEIVVSTLCERENLPRIPTTICVSLFLWLTILFNVFSLNISIAQLINYILVYYHTFNIPGSVWKQRVSPNERGEQCKSEQKFWPLPVSFFCIMGVTASQNIRKSGLKGNVSLNKGVSSIVTETSNEENPTLFQKICSRSISFL